MKKRIFSTVALWLVVIAVPLIFGPTGLVLLLLALSAAAQFELYNLLRQIGFAPAMGLGIALGSILFLAPWFIPAASGISPATASVMTLGLIVCIFAFRFLSDPDLNQPQSSFTSTVVGILLIPFLLSFYVQMAREFIDHGMTAAAVLCPVWIVAVAKFTDVGGLLVGSKFGRRRLAPLISPNKTVEGAAGGILSAVVIGVLLLLLFRDSFPAAFTLPVAILIALIVAVSAIISDLFESAIKRQASSKDSGAMIPGIGGAFDLADSLVLAAPVGFLLFTLFVFGNDG